MTKANTAGYLQGVPDLFTFEIEAGVLLACLLTDSKKLKNIKYKL